MSSVRSRKDTGLLLLDFRYQGARCREQTLLPDTADNRARLVKLAERIQRSIINGSFVYADFFPDSPRAKRAAATPTPDASGECESVAARSMGADDSALFRDFAEVWYVESVPRWRKRHREIMRALLDRFFIPAFGMKRLNGISRADLLGFRAELAKRPGRGGQTLNAKTINKRMTQVKAIINEGCDRYGLVSPCRGVKPLKQKRSEVHPFSLEEVDRLIETVRVDYRPYLTVRCLTGLRTGEVNGLQWCDIDFDQNVFRVERTLSRNGDGEPKTDLSKRRIPMVPEVRAAFCVQLAQRMDGCDWVFHSARANPIDAVNFTNRVWYPLLRYLGFRKRPPYQMRHTAATLMLAAGENPEWVAHMLGHSTTEMLFRVYSRFVPNLTRNDGRAFAGLLKARGESPSEPHQPDAKASLLGGLSPAQKAELLTELSRELAQMRSPG